MSHTKALGDWLFELRLKGQKGIARGKYFFKDVIQNRKNFDTGLI